MLICKSENSLEPPSSPRAVCPAHAQFPGQSTSRKLNQSPRRNEFTYFFDLDWLPPRGRGVTFRPWHSGGVSWARQGSTWPGGNAPLVLVNFIRPWILGGWLPLNKDGGPPSVQNPILSNRKEGERGEGGQREKGTYPPLLERRLSIRNRFSGHVREYPRSEMGSSMMQAFVVSIWKWFTL